MSALDARIDPADDHEGGPRIEVTTGPETWRRLLALITKGGLPDTYVTAGQLVHIERVSGRSVHDRGDEDSPLPIASSVSTPDLLAGWLARHAYVYKTDLRSGKARELETFPADNVLKKVLAPRHWEGVPVLLGIIGAPVLRDDGTLLQDNGYDAATGLYLEKKVQLDRVPARPTSEQVASARAFIVDQLLGDFPWKTKSDKANYAAVLVTQILRPYLKCPVPLVLITATMPSSGKTILTAATGMLYGQKFLAWPHRDEELSKTITTALSEPAGVVIFDNLDEGTIIDSPTLAALLTADTWSARAFGRNDKMLTYANDRVWIATGNNLQLGGDMGSRTIVINLDPDMPDPEARTGFTVPNLPQQILNQEFQAKVLWNLLVLVADWVNAGSPRRYGITLRQFTPWLERVGGFLEHHGVDDFFGNRDETKSINEADAVWHAFLYTWHELYPGKRFKVEELRRTADTDWPGDPLDDGPWRGTFHKDRTGRPASPVALGRLLKGRVGRWHGRYVLRSVRDTRTAQPIYWVEKSEDDARNSERRSETPVTPANSCTEPLSRANVS